MEQKPIISVVMYNFHVSVVWNIVMSRLREHHKCLPNEVLCRFGLGNSSVSVCVFGSLDSCIWRYTGNLRLGMPSISELLRWVF